MLTLICVPLYFMSRRFTVRQKMMAGVVIAVFIISFNVSTLDLVWHGFQRPNWLNYRYSFMLCFFLLVLAYRAYLCMQDNAPRTIVAICAFLAIFVVIAQKLGLENMPDFEAIWFSLFCIALYLLVLCMSRHAEYRENTSLIIVILVCLEVFCSGLTNVVALDKDVYYSKYSSYNDFMAKLRPIVETVQENDTSFYRMEKTEHRKTNDNMALNIRGLSNSTSTLNAETIQFLNRMGYSSKSHWTKYLGGTPVNDSLLGLKYIISDEDLSDYYTAAYTEGLYTAYLNPYALSLAYAVSDDVGQIEFGSTATPSNDLTNWSAPCWAKITLRFSSPLRRAPPTPTTVMCPTSQATLNTCPPTKTRMPTSTILSPPQMTAKCSSICPASIRVRLV